MIQRIRKHILAFKKNLNRSLAKNNSSARLEPDSKGQVAIILIIMTAIALIFYAVTLNLGRMSGAKTMTTMAAEKTASVLASQMASYAQKLVKENLKGSLEVCDKTSLFTAIISMIIIIIVAVIAIILAPVTSGRIYHCDGDCCDHSFHCLSCHAGNSCPAGDHQHVEQDHRRDDVA